ncbi:MAG TPA: choice-of-anchor D domain-containing protein, partial [Lacipirellulaceae bacterium]
ANLSGGNFLISSSGGVNPGSLFQNNGTFNVTDGADISHNNFGGSAGRFNNAGTFNKSGVGTTTTISPQFNNTGTVNVDQGILELSGSSTSTGGTFAVDAGAILRFSSGSHTVDSASTITGAGDVDFSTNTVTLDGTYAITGITTVSGGTVNFNAPAATLTTLNLSGGTLGGSGSQNVSGAFNWTGGALANNGTTTIDNTATLTISGSSNKTLGNGGNTGRTLVNNGVANLSGGNLLISSSGGVNPGSLFQNNVTFNVTGESDISHNNFGGSAGRFTNAGTFNKSGTGTTTDISTVFTNSGTTNVNEGILSVSGSFTNYDAASDTLTGGTYNVTSNLRFLNADINTNRASITLNGPASQITDHTGAVNALADFSLNDTGAFFAILGDRSLTTTAAFINRGDFQLGGGAFNAASISNEASGEFFGFGRIDRAIMNAGVVRAAGGTLGVGGPISGPGTIQIDPGGSLELAGALADSDADFLFHNGTNLDLGADDILVREDYNNANFGVGNSFNHRANVTGTGQILADAAFTISASGDVSGSTIDFGNHRVGDGIDLSYQVNQNGTAGASPQLRAAIQTIVNGGNITDSRLSGPGVTPGNLAPIQAGANSGPLGVRFEATSAGALVGQTVHIEDNFDNVASLTLGITGAAYNMASAGLDPTDLNFGNVHVGDPIAAVPIRITNTAPAGAFSEDLLADNFVITDDVTLSGGSPPSVQVVAGGSNNQVMLLLDISQAGPRAGSLKMDLTTTGEVNGVPIAGLLPLMISDPSVSVRATAYRLANPNPHTPEPVDFGIIHVGDTPQQALTIGNGAPADGFSESLDAAIGNPTGSATTNGGSFTALAPGATNNSSLVVGIDTSTAGAKSGTATISLTSDGAGSSGLGLTELPLQVVNVQAQVNNFAVADVAKLAGDGTFSMTGASEFTLDLGTVIMGQPSLQAELGIVNDVLAPADDLAGSFTLAAPDFTLAGFDPFNGLAAGSTRGGLMVEFDTSMVGMFSGQVTLNARSTNPRPFSVDLAPITIRLRGEVQPIPEPATLTLLIALLAFPVLRRR